MIGRGTSRQKQREKSGNAIYSCRRWIRKHQSKQNFFNALIENIFFKFVALVAILNQYK